MPRSSVLMEKWYLLRALVGCSSRSRLDEPPPAPKDAKVEPSPTKSVDVSVVHFEGPAVELPKQESFTLLAPGAGATAELRYQLAAGTTTHHAETRLSSKRLAGGKWEPVVELPAIRDGFAVTIDPDATRPLLMRPLVGAVAGKPNVAGEQYLATWRTIENRRFTLGVDPQGRIGAIVFGDDPTNARSTAEKDELVQRLLATVVPLPTEPVGVGAKWRVVTALRQRPAVVKQTATYTLLARTATSWKLGVQIQRVGEEQVIADPALPKGMAANLVALVRKLDGTLVVDPRRLFPDGALTVQSTLHVRIDMPGHLEEQILDDTGTIKLSTD